MSNPVALKIPRFDVGDVDAHRRASAWSDILNEHIWSIDTAFPEGVRSGRYQGVAVDRLRVATITTDPVHVERRASHIARDATDAYFLILPLGGDIAVGQRGRELTIRRGTFTFVSGVDPSTYVQGGTETLHAVTIPGSMLRARKPDADDHLCGDFGASDMQQIFADFAGSFCRHAPSLDEDAVRRMHDSLLDMLALLLERTDVTSAESAVLLAHRRRIIGLIEHHFREPAVNLSWIAASLRLSPRYVQQILARHGETVSGLLRRRRISEARRMLDSRGASRASIATVAYAVGYSDPAYFSRVFRQATGTPPMDYASRPG